MRTNTAVNPGKTDRYAWDIAPCSSKYSQKHGDTGHKALCPVSPGHTRVTFGPGHNSVTASETRHISMPIVGGLAACAVWSGRLLPG